MQASETGKKPLKNKQQEEARQCFQKIVSSMCLIARQGQAFRGHISENSYLYQLLNLRAEDDPNLRKWFTDCKTMYTSPKSQNEILIIMAKTIIRGIAAQIRSLPIVQFSVIVDGTQDTSGDEQESLSALCGP